MTESALLGRFFLWIAALLLCLPLRSWLSRGLLWTTGRVPVLHTSLALTARIAVTALLVAISVCLLVGATNNAFLYFNF